MARPHAAMKKPAQAALDGFCMKRPCSRWCLSDLSAARGGAEGLVQTCLHSLGTHVSAVTLAGRWCGSQDASTIDLGAGSDRADTCGQRVSMNSGPRSGAHGIEGRRVNATIGTGSKSIDGSEAGSSDQGGSDKFRVHDEILF